MNTKVVILAVVVAVVAIGEARQECRALSKVASKKWCLENCTNVSSSSVPGTVA